LGLFLTPHVVTRGLHGSFGMRLGCGTSPSSLDQHQLAKPKRKANAIGVRVGTWDNYGFAFTRCGSN